MLFVIGPFANIIKIQMQQCLSFLALFDEDNALGNELLLEPEKNLSAFNKAAISAQKNLLLELEREDDCENYKIKLKISIRLDELPDFGDSVFPSNNDIGYFVRISGTVIKAGIPKFLEYERDYFCEKCNFSVTSYAIYEKYYLINAPSKCSQCYSTQFKIKENKEMKFIDYQEIKVQEHFGKSKVGTMPKTMLVTLEGDLVDSCKPGDDVIIM